MTDAAADRSLAVITPWYPNRQNPFAGAFVRAMVAATAPGLDSVNVYHLDQWPAKVSTTEDLKAVEVLRDLLRHAQYRSNTVEDAGLVYVPVPTPRGLTYAVAARRFAAMLSAALGGRKLSERVVHAHVGIPGGWIALENAAPDAKVFVTEHATYLDRVLAQPDSRQMYDEVISRATGFFAVGEPVRQPLVEAFPHHADKIKLIPNPIPFNAIRPEPVRDLKRWLFMGNLIERKGVHLLLEAFAKCHSEDGSLTLSIVGEGALRPTLRARAVELGVRDVVNFVDPLPPDEALAALREHDLLVHVSRLETFGMTIVEAVAMGTPVLITRCGGPEESLAGIETLAGEFVDVDDNPDTIVEGFRSLRKRFPDTLDLPRAREVLESRYGYPAVSRAHHRAWFGDVEAVG